MNVMSNFRGRALAAARPIAHFMFCFRSLSSTSDCDSVQSRMYLTSSRPFSSVIIPFAQSLSVESSYILSTWTVQKSLRQSTSRWTWSSCRSASQSSQSYAVLAFQLTRLPLHHRRVFIKLRGDRSVKGVLHASRNVLPRCNF